MTTASAKTRRNAGFARSFYDALVLVGTAARVSHAVRMHRQPDAADLKRLGIDHPISV